MSERQEGPGFSASVLASGPASREELAACFSPDYATARDRFLAAAARRRLDIETHRFAARGPGGEALFLDAARLGPADARRLVVVSSGLHGIEGFFGSAVQLAWLDSRAGRPEFALPPGTALLFLHALNPFGFAALRRVNENNVDLNRNFLDDPAVLEGDAAYRDSREASRRLQPFLNPASPPPRWDAFMLRALHCLLREGWRAWRREQGGQRLFPLRPGVLLQLGLDELRRALPVGQYGHPQGLFFGGSKPQETTLLLQERFPHWAAKARQVLHLDFHTGLGAWGSCKLHLVDAEGSAREGWASRHFGTMRVEPWGGRGARQGGPYCAFGTMNAALRTHLPHLRYDGLTAEFGTYPALAVLAALRAENRAHFHARTGSPAWRRAKADLREAFCPSDRRWRESVVAEGVSLIDIALAIPPEGEESSA